MSEAVPAVVIVLLTALLFSDIVVFVKCQTFKTSQSALISVCLALDLLTRISQFTIKLIPSVGDVSTAKDFQESYRDTT